MIESCKIPSAKPIWNGFCIVTVRELNSYPYFTKGWILQILLQIFCLIQLLPGQIQIVTAEVTICSGLFVDRTTQVQHLDNACRTQVEVLTDDLNQLLIGNLAGAESVCHDRGRLCYADCVRQLDFALVSQSCCNNVLCNITCCVSCASVNLGAVLAGKSAAAMTCISAVGVYDDLTAGQTSVTVRSADYETSGRVDEELGVLIDQLCRQNRIKDIFFDILVNLFLCYIGIMLCG